MVSSAASPSTGPTTRPRSGALRWGFSRSTAEIATRGSRSRFRAFRLPGWVKKTTWSPSTPIQTGTECGEPSGSVVARWAKLRASRSSRTSAGSATTSGLDGLGRARGAPRDERRHLAGVAVQAPVAERVLGLHQLVDLRRALVDDRRARVAEVALDAVLGRVAVRAEDLDRVVRSREGRLRRVPLRERGLARVPPALVLHPRRLHDEELRGLVAEHHRGDHVLDELELADRLPERPALARVLDRALEAGADDAARAGGDGEAPLVEPVHRDLEALPLLAHEVLGRHLDVLEEELARGAGPDAELVLRVRRREAGRALLDDEGRDALVLRGRVGLREDERVVGDGGVGDPVLLAVQDVRVALAAAGRLHLRHVRSGPGPWDAETGSLLPGCLPHQSGLLL